MRGDAPNLFPCWTDREDPQLACRRIPVSSASVSAIGLAFMLLACCDLATISGKSAGVTPKRDSGRHV